MISGDNSNEDDRKLKPFPGPSGVNRQKQNPYQFSPEELRVIKDCNRDSFLQRCIPLGTALGIATYFGVSTGYIRPTARFGATPKVVVAVVIGYFVGKFSYQYKCAEKLMQLPNSKIGEMLRQRKKGFFKETLEPGLGSGMSLAPFSGMGAGEQYSDVGPTNTNDMDTTRPQYEGLDDSQRPSVDSTHTNYEEDMPPVQHHATSYEELRRKNRDDFQQKRIINYRGDVSGATMPVDTSTRQQEEEASPRTSPPSISAPPPATSTRTNKYGDAIV